MIFKDVNIRELEKLVEERDKAAGRKKQPTNRAGDIPPAPVDYGSFPEDAYISSISTLPCK